MQLSNHALLSTLQYHGGTNFGRTSAVFTTTRYYDEAPLDEYGKHFYFYLSFEIPSLKKPYYIFFFNSFVSLSTL